MEKDFKVVKNGTTLDIVLGSELSTANAPALAKELSSYCGQDIEKVVFDATGLTYLSSAGIRTFFFVYHELGSHIEIVVVNCVKEIYNILEYVGLNSIVKFEESIEKKNQYRIDHLGDMGLSEIEERAQQRKKDLEDFSANNDVVCYNMKLGQED